MNCFKNGWTTNPPEVINISRDELVPTQVRHEHIHCTKDLRDACLAYLIRNELSISNDNTSGSAAGASTGACNAYNGDGDVEDLGASLDSYTLTNLPSVPSNSLETRQFHQAIIFIDDASTILRIQKVVEIALLARVQQKKATAEKHLENKVGVLLETMSLDARANVLADFRYFHVLFSAFYFILFIIIIIIIIYDYCIFFLI